MQSLVRNGDVADIVADYGHLVVDECHHLSAASFELVAPRRDTWSAYPRPWHGRTGIIPLSSCNAARFATGLMQEFKPPNVAFAIAHPIVQRSLNCRPLWRLSNAPPCPQSIRLWRRTAGGTI
jgi:hypothetical protein